MSELITPAQIQMYAPRCEVVLVAVGLNAAANKYNINTNRRIRHWLATLYVESNGFTRLVENLNYSAPRLTQVWPKRFPDLKAAEPYAGNPQKLAEKVYGGRLGNMQPGEGAKYLGRGYIQLTGKYNYAKASEALGMDLVSKPEIVATHSVAAKVAGWYWDAHGCNNLVDADTGERVISDIQAHIAANEEDDLVQARKAVNGGLIGVDHVRKALNRAGNIWK